MNAIVISATVFLFISYVNGQLFESPCPHILKYEEQTANDRWKGVLELRNRDGLEGIWLNILLDSKADVLVNNFGPASSLNNQNFAIINADYVLQPGASLRVKFTVKYNPDKPTPNVASLKLNGVEICKQIRGASEAGSSNDVNDSNNVITEAPKAPHTKSSGKTKTRVDVFDGMCGMKPQARPLIYNSRKADVHWPWHIAIMILKNRKFDYHCGGSLITENHVLTAAHCVTHLSTKKLIDNDMFVLYLGMTDLSDPGPSFKLRLVENIKVHNEFSPVRYHNDLAIMELSNPVEFNDFIRPICLWDGDLAIRDLIGEYGTVVGWGIDNSNKTAPDLMEARMPVVGLEICLYHDRNFYSQFTSPKTYCAGGGSEGSSVCSGDSGGGMVFPKPGTAGKDEVWYIRGVVSVAPLDRDSVCNTNSYAVFTDVAQHLDWIKQTADLK